MLRYLNLAHHLGAPVPPCPPRFRLGLGAEVESPLLPDAGRRGLVVLHPGARWPSKLWPAAAWAELADWLSREHGLQVAITGSAADRELAAQICAAMQEPALNLAGRTSLPELAAVLRRARLAVTTDTGAMHLAAALGTPVVALFGPTAPWRTGPFGAGPPDRAPGSGLQPLLQAPLPGAPLSDGPGPGDGAGGLRENLVSD